MITYWNKQRKQLNNMPQDLDFSAVHFGYRHFQAKKWQPRHSFIYLNGRRMITFFYDWNIFERRLSDKWGFCIGIVSGFLSSIFFTVSFSAIEWNTSTWNWTPSRSLQISISMTLFIWRRSEATMGNAIHMEIFQKREIRLVLPATGVLLHYC